MKEKESAHTVGISRPANRGRCEHAVLGRRSSHQCFNKRRTAANVSSLGCQHRSLVGGVGPRVEIPA
jgi:hypothetical protein